jgi:diketogulonate reductase-like aldo/keto reductase
MQIPVKKLKSGFSLSEYGFGTWHMGGAMKPNPNNDDRADVASIRAAIEQGVSQIDTAELYADGHAEELVGEAISGYERSRLFLISKVKGAHMAHDQVLISCKKSLKRLRTNYLDLYLLHQRNARLPLDKTMQAMDELMDEGLIRQIGVSNFSVESLKLAQSYTKHPIVYNQVHYNLEYREPEKSGLLEYCQKNDIFIGAWRPVQEGALMSNPPDILLEMSKAYKKTCAQIAINWLVSQDHVVTLSKTSSIEHLKENLGALDWRLSSQDIERLRNEYPDQKDISDVVALG